MDNSCINLKNITIVLICPRYSENIGAACRAVCNMGLSKLIVVNPDDFDSEKVCKMATHNAKDVVNNIIVFDNINQALSDFNYIVGTTARLGKHRCSVNLPETMAKFLTPISKENKIAILFGPEASGLSNDHIKYCNKLINIPTHEFSSLNLAQAVMIICYSLFLQKKDKTHQPRLPRIANHHELEGMYGQLKDILIKINFINPENPDYWMNNIRTFLGRLNLKAKEVSIIRGICRQINWYGSRKQNL